MPNRTKPVKTGDGAIVQELLVDNGDGSFSSGLAVGGAGGGAPLPVSVASDARTGALSGGVWTLGSASVVESIAIPNSARGFRLRPTADTKFAVGEDPVASGAETLTVGNTAYANETEARLIDSGTGRTLRLLTTLAGSSCGVGFF